MPPRVDAPYTPPLAMLLTITTTERPATDLGFLLHKNPAHVRTIEIANGRAHVFYPEASDERCTAALLLEIDAVHLVRGAEGSGDGATSDEYVNDRPYVTSSFTAVAIAQLFGTALNGRSKERQELADRPIQLEASVSALSCGDGEPFIRALFEPLGYRIEVTRHPLDARFPEWGEGSLFDVRLVANARLRDLLAHLYVLLPVLDDDKHYWVGDDEAEKLLRHGESWLAAHPERERVVARYLKHQSRLARSTLARLTAEEDVDPDATREAQDESEATIERRTSLDEHRRGAVLAALRASGATSVVDLGCGEGKLVRELLAVPQFNRVTGIDVSHRALQRARERLGVERMPPAVRARLELRQGSLVYRDASLSGFDAAALVEVIEHVEPDRLRALERAVFEFARPSTVVVTTPNVEYNARFESLPAGRFRHRDHRFEWTRDEFRAWSSAVASRNGYAVRLLPIGPEDVELGSPTQMAVFQRG